MSNITLQGRQNYREPYVGMPVPIHNFEGQSVCDAVNACPLAMAYVPMQQWHHTYEPAEGWHRGTIFPELDLPFLGGGGR